MKKNDLTKKCRLHDLTLTMYNNEFVTGIELNREATVSETLYVLGKIFGFDLKNVKDEMTPKEKSEYNQTVTAAFNDFLSGNIDYDEFSMMIRFPSDESIWLGTFVDMLGYLTKKGVI